MTLCKACGVVEGKEVKFYTCNGCANAFKEWINALKEIEDLQL